MKNLLKNTIFKSIEIILFPVTIVTAVWMRFLTLGNMGTIRKTILAEKILMKFGVLPVRDHYYNPLINPKKHLRKPLTGVRNLPGINLNDKLQLETLSRFNYNEELLTYPLEKKESDHVGFFYNNPSFNSGDAEYLYNIIRAFKPKKVIEVGSGYSTLLALDALHKNESDDPIYSCEHICIEPYEQPWLEQTSSKILREKVENIDISLFESLKENDILFIDSSHIIRPQGDVLFEYLEILPVLRKGTLVHIHDIFTPRDYLEEWILEEHLLWNEQYLLEAFLTGNDQWEIIGAVNYLYNKYEKEVEDKCPILGQQAGRRPGSFWMRKK